MEIEAKIPISEEILLALRISKEHFENEAKKFTALEYYKQNKLSIGQAADLANMNEEDFIRYLGENKISIFNFNYSDEIKEDVKNA